jgi:hypothetical protein
MQFTDGEQLVLDEMIRARNADLPKPPWMQSHRYMRLKKAARRHIAELPATVAGTDPPLYNASRRVTFAPVGKFAIHESRDSRTPICALANHFASHPELQRVDLGSGPVTCGHCANVR